MKPDFINAKQSCCCLLTLLLLFTFDAISQNSIDNLKFEDNTVYLFSRGTKTKSGLIAKKFNSNDRYITHVGIGFVENNKMRIYNVIDCDTTKTALVIDNLKSFVCEKAYYLSIWKCKSNKQEFLKLKKICHEYSSRKVYFDYSFKLNEKDNILYCSEFCSRVLKVINSTKFNFHPKKMKLESFYRAVLSRDELLYYPVDFFQEGKLFSKIFEANFNAEKT
ncbi:hypothetical protein [Flavobacterium phycosphaerae]|uniref:hypothetical protein n=1 Tax=Flavobacterium phycosphaerae TaxID=2697515 RepID=UPI001389FC85|nr:hypothetical protein [Flavobacterium phycosphaerae]